MKKTALLVLLAVLALVGPLLTPPPATALGAAGNAALVDGRCPASASICHYRLPDSILAARQACFRAEADQRGIPRDTDAYIAWYDAHRGTPAAADWNRAFKACQDRHEVPGGKWNWAAMVYVGSER